METKKKVVIIDPVLQVIFGGCYYNYKDLYNLGKFDTFDIRQVDYNSDTDTGNDLVVDDEGLLKANQRYFEFAGVGSFAGVGILTGSDHVTGNSIDTTWTVDQVQRAISWKPKGFKIDPYMEFIPLRF